MSLTKSKGNMYEWIDAHWNPIKGECQHRCPYCYVEHSRAKNFYKGECYLEVKDLKTNLGKDQIIFVGSMNDMWGEWVPWDWIKKVFYHCQNYPTNQYIFQSKNPKRFFNFATNFYFEPVKRFHLGTTIETNEYPERFKTNAPSINERFKSIESLSRRRKTFITIEPIMDFNLEQLVDMIRSIDPEFVVIGADSKNHNLIEPPWDKVQMLIDELTKFTEIRQKTNLERLKHG